MTALIVLGCAAGYVLLGVFVGKFCGMSRTNEDYQ